MNDSPDGAPAGAAETAPEPSHSWLAALRARLGLPGAPTLRAMLEDALKGAAGDGRTFSAEERAMLLGVLRFGALRVVDVMVQRAEAQDAQQHLALLGREGAAVAGALERILQHRPQGRGAGQAEPGA